jgi:hypothetical protein
MKSRYVRAGAWTLPVLLLPAAAAAAELTEVVDAFDDDFDQPYGFHIEPSFRQVQERGVITREAPCGAGTEPACDFDTTGLVRELDYRRVTNILDFDFQIGLYKDFEFHVRLPVVLSDQRNLTFADGVTQANSRIFPDLARVEADLSRAAASESVFFDSYRLFDVPNDGPRRSGLGDMTFGFSWSPFNDRRADHVSNLTLSFDYVGPTGTPQRANNTGVGRGVHELQFAVATSRYFEDAHMEPYFGMRFAAPLAASNGLFIGNSNSTTTAPGPRFSFTTGTEIMMYEDTAAGAHYTADLGMDFGFQFEGRDYSPLFDALAGSSCNGTTPAAAGFGALPDGNVYNPTAPLPRAADAACAWVVQQPGNAQFGPGGTLAVNTPYAHNGITDIESFASVGGHVGLNLQPNRYVRFRMGFGMLYQSPHFLTVADAGRDADNTGVVDLNPQGTQDGIVERNPNYNLALDTLGRRLRLENSVILQWTIGAAFQF